MKIIIPIQDLLKMIQDQNDKSLMIEIDGGEIIQYSLIDKTSERVIDLDQIS